MAAEPRGFWAAKIPANERHTLVLPDEFVLRLSSVALALTNPKVLKYLFVINNHSLTTSTAYSGLKARCAPEQPLRQPRGARPRAGHSDRREMPLAILRVIFLWSIKGDAYALEPNTTLQVFHCFLVVALTGFVQECWQPRDSCERVLG